MIALIEKEELLMSKFGLRCLEKAHPKFSNKHQYRGAIYVHLNFLVT